MKTVCIQYAMTKEAEPFLKQLTFREIPSEDNRFPFKFYRFDGISNLQVILGLAGLDPKHQVDSIGSVPATLLAYHLIQRFRPHLFINAGTAGGYQSKGASIGDVYFGKSYVSFHSRRNTIPGFDQYSRGLHPVVDASNIAVKLGCKQGIVSSGDALDCSQQDAELILKNGAELKEMEAGAIGWVTQMTRTPLMPIKTVTDWVDHPAETALQFAQNYEKASESLAKIVVKCLDVLATAPWSFEV